MKKQIDCKYCNKKKLSKDEIGLNKKLLGEKISYYLCLKCLAEELEVTEEDMLYKIEEYKEDGCKLFS
ncbi:MAG: hypothetical protein IJP71_06685 [Lachnospiraceae bacterium]|nr:hypothetical protein [Lachnospiraceae bacterium]